MAREGEENEYKPEEYMSKTDDDDSKSGKAKEVVKEKEEVKPFVAKEDYQVRQALNYIKGYQVFKAAEWKSSTNDGVKTALDQSKN